MGQPGDGGIDVTQDGALARADRSGGKHSVGGQLGQKNDVTRRQDSRWRETASKGARRPGSETMWRVGRQGVTQPSIFNITEIALSAESLISSLTHFLSLVPGNLVHVALRWLCRVESHYFPPTRVS